jgi:hypothetical protein
MQAAHRPHLDTILMLVSCALAFLAPFEVFVVAYAALGPLHYLTELSWLHERSYFVERRDHALPLWAIAAGLVAGPYVGSPWNQPTALFFVALIVGVMLGRRQSVAVTAAAAVLGVIVGLWLRNVHVFYVVCAWLLPTVIHVFLFTGVFLAVGLRRAPSYGGALSAVVFVACAVGCMVGSASAYDPTAATRTAYDAFASLNLFGLHAAGRAEATWADVYTTADSLRVTRFLAFAYTYHYLNWFSKTQVLGWHRVPRLRLGLVGAAWLLAVALYAYDYDLGFRVLLALSTAHVVLEFPLNARALGELLAWPRNAGTLAAA